MSYCLIVFLVITFTCTIAFSCRRDRHHHHYQHHHCHCHHHHQPAAWTLLLLINIIIIIIHLHHHLVSMIMITLSTLSSFIIIATKHHSHPSATSFHHKHHIVTTNIPGHQVHMHHHSYQIAINVTSNPPGGVLPYMDYTWMIRWTGMGFRVSCHKQGICFYSISEFPEFLVIFRVLSFIKSISSTLITYTCPHKPIRVINRLYKFRFFCHKQGTVLGSQRNTPHPNPGGVPPPPPGHPSEIKSLFW